MTFLFRALAAAGRRCMVGGAVGFVGVGILFGALAGKPPATTLWGNDLDPYIIMWTVEWVYHTIFERLTPFDVWNANSFFPHSNSLAFADSMFSAQLFYAPLRLLGLAPLPSLYLTMAGFCILGAVLTDRLLHRFDFTAGERALIVAAAHFSLPMTGFLMGHFQLFAMQLVPPFLLALHRLLSEWRGRDLILVTVLFCLAGGFATYFVPMVGLVAALLLLLLSHQLLRRHGVGGMLGSLGWKSIASCVALLGVFFVVQLRPYLALFGTLPPQAMTDTYVYSARPWSVLLHPTSYSIWYTPAAVDWGYWERAAFPGLPLLLLTAAGGIAVMLRRPVTRLAAEGSIIPLARYAGVVLVISWVLSWGPYLQPCACSDDRIYLPFLVLAKLIPGVENIRAPGRYAQFFGLPMGIMAVMAVRWATPRLRHVGPVAAVLALVVLVDQRPRTPTYPFDAAHAEFFRAAKPLIQEGEPLIVLPIAGTDHITTWSNLVRQLAASTIHWARLVTGAGSRSTPELGELLQLDGRLRDGTGTLTDIVAFARRLGISSLVLFPGDYPPPAHERILAQAEKLEGRILLRNPEGLILQLGR